jgi:Cu-processing system permease protein
MNLAAFNHERSWLDAGVIIVIAAKEIRDSLRNRWFILYTTAFTVLAMALSSMSLAGTGSSGLAGFGRTTASLVNLVTLIVPLMALTAGAASLASERERGTLSYLLAQPVNRSEVLVGKYLGLAVALLASLSLGFGVSAAVIAWRSGSANAIDFVRLVALAYALSLAMLSIGFLISAMARRAGVANASALFVWLALVFVGDLGLMGGTIAFKIQVQQLFHLSLINPLQVFKFASLGAIHASLDVLGPAGLYATQTYGNSLTLLFAGALAAWIILPLVAAMTVFRMRGAS